MATRRSFLPLDPLASALGLPRKWLKEQADAGSIPSLSVNGRRVFDVELVRRALIDRMTSKCPTDWEPG